MELLRVSVLVETPWCAETWVQLLSWRQPGCKSSSTRSLLAWVVISNITTPSAQQPSPVSHDPPHQQDFLPILEHVASPANYFWMFSLKSKTVLPISFASGTGISRSRPPTYEEAQILGHFRAAILKDVNVLVQEFEVCDFLADLR